MGLDAEEGKVCAFLVQRGETFNLEGDLYLECHSESLLFERQRCGDAVMQLLTEVLQGAWRC